MSVSVMETDVQKLSDEELTTRLQSLGETVGPLTPTTRPLFERRLLRHLNDVVLSDEGPFIQQQQQQPETPPHHGCRPETMSFTPPRTPTGSNIRKDEIALSFTPPRTPAKHGSANDGTSSVIYYGVQVPSSLECVEEKRVFINKQDVLKFMKQYPGSRFKAFSNEQDAQGFANLSPASQLLQSPAPASNQAKDRPPVSEGSSFRGPKSQDLVKLRKAIERGDLEEVKSLVWSNPRYLIGSGDTPAILQEGFRYNALHVVASRNQAEVGRLVIDILEDKRFTQLMYPDDSDETRDSRIHFLVDLYLNMPDKGFCESPLHFACKFGHPEVVDLLASHPCTDKHRDNKYGEKPRDVVCTRIKVPSAEVKEKIYKLLEDRVYVPLMRSEDNSCPARIAKPWSSSASARGRTSGRRREELGVGFGPGASPRESKLSVKAYAGPMSPTEADSFRKLWAHPRSPASPEVRKDLEIRRRDSEKGLERIGRMLAHNKQISWKEYWDFLGCFTDLSTPAGLKQLEQHLQEQWSQTEKRASWDEDLCALGERLDKIHLSSNPASPMNSRAELTDPSALFCDKLKPEAGSSGHDGDGSPTTVGPDHDVQVDALARNLLGEFSKLSDPDGANNNTLISRSSPVFSTSSLAVEGEASENETERRDKHGESKSLASRDAKASLTATSEGLEEDDSSQFSDGDYLTADEDSDLEDSFEDCVDPVVFPDSDSSTRVFVMGEEPTKRDVDVLRALEGLLVSPVSYPYITRWKNQVACFPEQTRASWHTPARKRQSLAAPHSKPASSRHIGYYDSPSFENISGLSSNSSASESDDSFEDRHADYRANVFSPDGRLE